MATYQAVENAIRSRFDTQITVAENVTTIHDNQDAEPPTTGKWIRLAIIPGETEQVELGASKRFRTFGLMVAQIFEEIGKGTKATNLLINAINTSGIFRSVRVGGVSYRTPMILRIGRVGNWYQTNCNVPWYSDDIET